MIYFGLFRIPDLENVEINTKIKSVACIQPEIEEVMIVGVCLTLIFKVDLQGQVIYFGLFEILDLENVEINTKIESVACLQSEIRKVTQMRRANVCLTLIFKVNRQGQVIYFSLFEIPDLENVEINTKIISLL